MNADNSQSKITKMKRAVFLDRDGTLIEEANYLARAADLKLFPFAARAVRLFNENDFLVVLITNQSGIARGFFSESDLSEIHEKLISDLNEEGAKLDAIYFCPHAPDDECVCRKPKTAMIKHAARDFAIDLENSWTIGDKAIDVELGCNAGTKTALVLTGYGRKEIDRLKNQPDLTTENLLAAAKTICSPQTKKLNNHP